MTRSLEDSLNLSTSTSDDKIAQAWRVSTKSIGNGQCIQAANLVDGCLAVRDSKDKSGPVLRFNESGWRTFITEVKSGIYDSF